MNVPKWIIVHHVGGTDTQPLLDTSDKTFENVNEYHRTKFNFPSSIGHYIGYHYFINKFGKVTQGRLDTDEGAHTIGKNSLSIGICLAGNFDATLPTVEQTVALTILLNRLKLKHNIPNENIVPHRKFAQKTCCGKLLSDNWARNLTDISALERLVETLKELLAKLKLK